MTTHKYIDRICVAVMVIAVVFTILFMNGESFGITPIIDADAEAHKLAQPFTDKDLDGDWDEGSAAHVRLEGTTGTISGNGAYMYKGDLVIQSAGDYVITGTLTDGCILVKAKKNAKVRIRLAETEIFCEDGPALCIKKADKVFLTLAEGTSNHLYSGEVYSDAATKDGEDGVIYSEEDLTINGSGALLVDGGCSHGIVTKSELVIAGGEITVGAKEDGLRAGELINITEAALTIEVGDDAIHAEDSLLVAGGTINITSCYEGLEARTVEIQDGDITIVCSDDGVNAGGTVAGGFGGMAGGHGGFRDFAGFGGETREPREFRDAPGERPMHPTDEQMPEGRPEPPADGQMSEGQPEPPADEQMLKPEGKTEKNDDSDSDEMPTVTISGGTLHVINASGVDADGIDSNGDIHITGGTVIIDLIGENGNCALDYGVENGGSCVIDGGLVLGAGDSGMVEEMSETSGQVSIMLLTGQSEAGTEVIVRTSEGREIMNVTVQFPFKSLVISSPELQVGNTYEIVAGDEVTTVEVDSTAVVVGKNSGFRSFEGFGGFKQRGAGEPQR